MAFWPNNKNNPMNYAFEPRESFQSAFHRLVGHDLRFVIELIERGGAEPQSVHNVRKAIKRVRALLRLARPVLNEEHFRCENARLREAAARLSGARDAEVMLLTLGTLAGKSRAKRKFMLCTTAFRDWLTERRDSQVQKLTKAGLAEALTLLHESRDSLVRLRFEGSGGDGLETGLAASMRTGRHNFMAAYRQNDGDAFHEFRKSVQLYHRAIMLFRHVWPELMAVYLEEAKELANTLGLEHDLSVLRTSVHSHQRLFPDKTKLDYLCELILARQQELRDSAFEPGRHLFMAETPKAFARRMITYLHNASSSSPSDDVIDDG